MDNKTQPIQLNNFRPSKKMGQNFLIDEQIARSIVNLAKASDYDLVIEVGPGIGILTQYLIQFNHPVIAVELDRRLASLLKSRFSHHKNLQIINNDILKVDLAKISEPYQRVLLISNLPYSISTPMMLHFLKQNKIQIFYCMLQKELVDRLIAKPENKAYGSISVLIQYYANIAKLLDVKPSAFDPQPKVDSNIIAIQKNQRAFDPEWAKFIQHCFQFKRKTLINNLKQHFPISKIQLVLRALKINSDIRAEALAAQTIFEIYKRLFK